MKQTPEELVSGILAGEKTALARAITRVENADPDAPRILQALFPRTGKSWRVGITGPPGCGKSTLVNAVTGFYRKSGLTVGIVAVDPSSPFTGGALLGDRVRMQSIAMDDGVFIRSMASRGELGGLASTTQDVADLMDAFGKDVILLETVGVGQSEVEIADAADATLVVLSPESGDGIQAMKAGLMEIADIIVVNKADREGVDRSVVEIEMMIRLKDWADDCWRPPILKAQATVGAGIKELCDTILMHRDFLSAGGRITGKRRKSYRKRLMSSADSMFRRLMWREREKDLETELDRVASFEITPGNAAANLFDRAFGGQNQAE